MASKIAKLVQTAVTFEKMAQSPSDWLPRPPPASDAMSQVASNYEAAAQPSAPEMKTNLKTTQPSTGSLVKQVQQTITRFLTQNDLIRHTPLLFQAQNSLITNPASKMTDMSAWSTKDEDGLFGPRTATMLSFIKNKLQLPKEEGTEGLIAAMEKSMKANNPMGHAPTPGSVPNA